MLENFNEMEMKINVINNKNVTKFYLKLRVRGKKILRVKKFHNISFTSRK